MIKTNVGSFTALALTLGSFIQPSDSHDSESDRPGTATKSYSPMSGSPSKDLRRAGSLGQE
jgi:hypothetical protein